MKHFFEHLTELLAAGEPVVAVTVVDAVGSMPQHQGAKMLRGEIDARTRCVEWNLERDVGMTCGGAFRLLF